MEEKKLFLLAQKAQSMASTKTLCIHYNTMYTLQHYVYTTHTAHTATVYGDHTVAATSSL